MKKFERLPKDERKKEIKDAAAKLFIEKGFSNTTMENIIENVSLSKGGVYRLFPSTEAVLSEIIVDGMRLRNTFFIEKIELIIKAEKKFSVNILASVICDSLFLAPEIAAVYVEFLIAKRRSVKLQQLYEEICKVTTEETLMFMAKYNIDVMFTQQNISFNVLTEMMNSLILSLHVLELQNFFASNKKVVCEMIEKLLLKDKK